MNASPSQTNTEIINLTGSTRLRRFALFLLSLLLSAPSVWLLLRGKEGGAFYFFFPALSALSLWMTVRRAQIRMEPKSLTLALGKSKKCHEWTQINALSHRSSFGGYALLGNLTKGDKGEQVVLGKFDASLSPKKVITRIEMYQLSLLLNQSPLAIFSENSAQKKRNRYAALLAVDDPNKAALLGRPDLLTRFNSIIRQDYDGCERTLLALVGSLAGYACRMAGDTFSATALSMGHPLNAAIVKTSDGKRIYYIGDVDGHLYKHSQSFFELVSSPLQYAGTPIPELNPIFEHCAEMAGKPEFGMVLSSDNHKIKETPLNLVRRFWPIFQPIMDQYCQKPIHRVSLLTVCAGIIMGETDSSICETTALEIIMECAVPMSKIGPEWLDSVDYSR